MREKFSFKSEFRTPKWQFLAKILGNFVDEIAHFGPDITSTLQTYFRKFYFLAKTHWSARHMPLATAVNQRAGQNEPF